MLGKRPEGRKVKNSKSAERCERCMQDAPSLNYDPLTKKSLCPACNRKLEIKRLIHGDNSKQGRIKQDVKSILKKEETNHE